MTDDSPAARTRRVLAEHGLPTGLLPSSQIASTIDADGRFEVTLQAEVRATFGGYRIAYAPTVTGELGTDEVRQLRGVTAKRGPLWFGVRRIVGDGDALVFHVGPVTRRLARAEFEPG